MRWLRSILAGLRGRAFSSGAWRPSPPEWAAPYQDGVFDEYNGPGVIRAYGDPKLL